MKTPLTKSFIFLIFFWCYQLILIGNDSTKYNISLNYYFDLSDTYGGGNLFSGEFSISKDWYGAKIMFGHFQSQYTFIFKVPYEEIGQTLEIPVPEMSIMQLGSLSGFIRPIQKRWISVDFIIGAVLAGSKSLYLDEIYYEYSLVENRFTYLYTDYQQEKKTHFGYQTGIDVSFYFLKRIGLQINMKVQDLSNGGTFFFMGGGLCFKL